MDNLTMSRLDSLSPDPVQACVPPLDCPPCPSPVTGRP